MVASAMGLHNREGDRLLGFAVADDLVIANIMFLKRDRHRITFASGPHDTLIDIIVFRRSLRNSLKMLGVLASAPTPSVHIQGDCSDQTKAQIHPTAPVLEAKRPNKCC